MMIVLPVYDLLLLPGVRFHFKKDVLADLPAESFAVDEEVLFLLQKTEKKKSELSPEDFYEIGLVGKVESVDDSGDVSIFVTDRVEYSDVEGEKGVFSASASICQKIQDFSEEESGTLFDELKQALLKFVSAFPWGMWARAFISHWHNLQELICALSAYLNLTQEEKYAIVAELSLRKQAELIRQTVYEFITVTKVGEEAENSQKASNERVYRESALKKQISILQQELDAMHPENVTDVQKFEQKIQESGMNDEARAEAEKVLNRLRQEGKDGHEYGMLYDYLDFVTSLCWKKAEFGGIDLKVAQEILDEKHYGLKKVKDRILQQLAVMALKQKQSGSILLFVGAPGTGKTSIGQSIAKALGRSYARVSLGGVRDEAEIRGHRRTYIGAMPGRIMEAMKRCGTSNPVIVLDEIDKLAKDYSGDPASALLEVLDPEQNFSFTDHYMNVPYDLSDVLFVCTANSADTIPEPLLNRMEMIRFSGYTSSEKFQIAKTHLLPQAMEEAGIQKSQLKVTDDAIRRIISEYTAEAGVRGLKKQIGVLCRQAAVRLVRGDEEKVSVGVKKIPEIFDGYGIRHEKHLDRPVSGVVTGLAWTQAGGEILFIETSAIEGSGKLSVTGQLGDVMKESVQIAMTLARSLYPKETKIWDKRNMHVHVPAGAVPKDGPSAGITITTALVSLALKKAVPVDIAMTGEVSLRGNVMPIGGLPEKLMAASRAGIRKVLIPFDNVEDLKEVPEEIKEELEIIPVKKIRDVLKYTGLLE